MKNDPKSLKLSQKFETFFITNYPMVKRYALLLLKCEEDAEDVTQEVFTKLWLQPECWEDKTQINSFLYTMTKNMILNQMKHRKIVSAYQENLANKIIQEESPGLKELLDPIYYKETILLIELALERMPVRRRKIFEMSRFEDMSNKEIAEKLNISVRAVENQIYMASNELRKVIIISHLILLTLFNH